MEGTQKSNNIIIVRMDEAIHWVMRRILWILLSGVLFAAAGGAYASAMTAAPMYRTTTKLYVTGVYTVVPSAGSYSLGKQVISNYIEIMKSRPVLEEVIENLGLNMSPQQLRNCISHSVPADTCMLEVTVSFTDAQWAKAVADELVVVSADYALEIMGCTPPTVYEEAGVPTAPYNVTRGPVLRYTVLGAFAGVVLAGVLVLLAYFVNTRFTTPGRTEDKLGIPVWGLLPKENKFKQGACEALASRLLYEAREAKVLSFIRATAEESSYEVMRQVASELQKAGKRVLLMDTNLGNPMWSAMLQGEPDGKGLCDYLTDGADRKTVIRKKEGEPDYISCGSKAINSGELLTGKAFSELQEQLKGEYDYIFMDVPPVQYGVDALAVIPFSDLTVWAVSAKKTKTYVAKDMKKKLEAKGITADGLVLTEVSVSRGGCFFKRKYGTYVGLYRK